MGSPRSPYRELDIPANVSRRPKRGKAADHGLFGGTNDKEKAHLFLNPPSLTAEQPRHVAGLGRIGRPFYHDPKTRICEKCRKPEFVVEGLPCGGKSR